MGLWPTKVAVSHVSLSGGLKVLSLVGISAPRQWRACAVRMSGIAARVCCQAHVALKAVRLAVHGAKLRIKDSWVAMIDDAHVEAAMSSALWVVTTAYVRSNDDAPLCVCKHE